jgi:low temperature requirement protein LtrA
MTMGSDPGAVPLVRPPTLRSDETRSATRLELFFDLAYVLAVGALAANLVEDVDWGGVGEFAFLLVLIWLSWVQFTLYNNRFDTDDLILRLGKFAATAAVLGCAASMSDAVGDLSTAFAASYLTGRVVLVLLYARAWRHVHEARETIDVYLVAMSVVAALWAVSLAVPAPARFVLWGVGALVDVAAPIIATRRSATAPLHLEHLPERFALLVILVLGEVAAAVVAGLHETHWAARSALIAGAGFVVAAAAWWAYFDVSAAVSTDALERAEAVAEAEEQANDTQEGDTGEDDVEKVDERHDLFVYGHLPVTGGLLAAGVGLEELIIHPTDPLPSAGSWLLAGGLAVFLAGAALILGGTERRLGRALRWPGLGVVVMVGLGALGPRDALAFGAATAVLLAAVAAVGTALSRRHEA